jgi:hypothetical protein
LPQFCGSNGLVTEEHMETRGRAFMAAEPGDRS